LEEWVPADGFVAVGQGAAVAVGLEMLQEVRVVVEIDVAEGGGTFDLMAYVALVGVVVAVGLRMVAMGFDVVVVVIDSGFSRLAEDLSLMGLGDLQVLRRGIVFEVVIVYHHLIAMGKSARSR